MVATPTLATPEWRIELADRVSVLSWSPDGRQLLASSLAGDGLVLEPSSGEVLAKLAHHPMGVLAGAWSPDGSRIAVGGQDCVLRLYDPRPRAPDGPLDAAPSTGAVLTVWLCPQTRNRYCSGSAP